MRSAALGVRSFGVTAEDGMKLTINSEGVEKMSYEDFIKSKQFNAVAVGFNPSGLSPHMFPFQHDIVDWACRRGRAAIFADTGLGKTIMELEWAAQVANETDRTVLIVAPLCVAHQHIRECAKFGFSARYVRKQSDVRDDDPIVITNYEMLGEFDLPMFGGVVLDESSILKNRDGKTRTKIINDCQSVQYRLSCTATPSPNDHMELGNQAEFLGLMTQTEMLAMFFTHDGGETQKWRLKGHGKTRFWEWMSTWAVCIRKPSDLGYTDEGYNLQPLCVHQHKVESHEPREGELFVSEAQTLPERRQAQRESIADRVARVAELVNSDDEQWLIWCHLNAESDALVKAIPDAEAVSGPDSIDSKEDRMNRFTNGDLRVLVTKPSIAGHGMNWQHCSHMAFVGLSDSFEQYYQAVRRCYRFGQKRPVEVHIVIAEAEGAVKANIERKQRQANEMSELMVVHMRDLMQKSVSGAIMEKIPYSEDVAEGDAWTLHLGDCVNVCRKIDDGSLDYTIFSPPFASLYTYSNSDYDMGNCKDDDEFFGQFRFLIGDLLRATKPGRLASFHCMNLPTSKSNHGYIGIRDFRGELIRAFQDEGWIFHSEVCIWKDPVTAMHRTKALGLLWKQIKKDSSMCRQGIPDYLVTMRKPGENRDRIEHTADEFPVDLWQKIASPVWTDINASRTLQYRSARDDDDERHICPLQLDVIERSLMLWSREGDLVFSPFAGIGSEGYCAIKMNRRFIGAELKRSYWQLAARTLQAAEQEQDDLFAAETA
jgi:superfamily II DNA or RNA helicase